MSQNFQYNNADFISKELNWLKLIIYKRRKQLFSSEEPGFDLPEPQPANVNNSIYCEFLSLNKFSRYERLLLILALSLHIEPGFLDILTPNDMAPLSYTHLFGQMSKGYKGIVPTGQTFLFLAAGKNKRLRFEVQSLLVKDHLFARQQILGILPSLEGEPIYSGKIIMSEFYVEFFTLGIQSQEKYSIRNCLNNQTPIT
jgi:hypothetical protein